MLKREGKGKQFTHALHGRLREREESSEWINRSGDWSHGLEMGVAQVMTRQWKKEQASSFLRCCTADFDLRQPVKQLYNIQEIVKLVPFSTAWL